MLRPVRCNMLHRSLHAFHNFYVQDQVVIFRVPVLVRSRLDIGYDGLGLLTSTDLDTGFFHPSDDSWQKCFGYVLMHKHGLHGITGARPLDLGVKTYFLRHLEISLAVNIHMADAFIVLDDRYR